MKLITLRNRTKVQNMILPVAKVYDCLYSTKNFMRQVEMWNIYISYGFIFSNLMLVVRIQAFTVFYWIPLNCFCLNFMKTTSRGKIPGLIYKKEEMRKYQNTNISLLPLFLSNAAISIKMLGMCSLERWYLGQFPNSNYFCEKPACLELGAIGGQWCFLTWDGRECACTCGRCERVYVFRSL